MNVKQYIVSFVGVSILLAISLWASIWFNQTHIGWLIESVPNSFEFSQQWQSRINQLSGVEHPAIVHFLPDDCLCRVLASKHAGQISETATQSGFNVYQLGSSNIEFATEIRDFVAIDHDISPIIAITHESGDIAYVGAYSDGVRCNTGNSMVESFLKSPDLLPTRAIIGLDVETCRCTQ